MTTKKNLDPKLYEKLVRAEDDLEAGRISRRQFNKILALVGATTGASLAEMQPAYAWVATRMRKRKSSPSAFAPAGSLRFSASASSYLSRTFGTPTNQYKWTFSTWFKRTRFNSSNYNDIFSSQTPNGNYYIDIMSWNDSFSVQYGLAGSWGNNLTETAVRRDPSAWSHLVVAVDLTQSIATNRIQMFVNGVQVALGGTAIGQNSDYKFNSNGVLHSLMAEYGSSASGFSDGCLSETYFIDGQTLTASSFGQIDSTTGQWSAKQYAGTFGNNGFYLPFKSAAAVNGTGTASGTYPSVAGVSGLGADFSGRNNHFTGSGLTVADAVLDSPSNNFCVLNALKPAPGAVPTGGGLVWLTALGTYPASMNGTFGMSSGKWYWEVVPDNAGSINGYAVGIVAEDSQNKNVDAATPGMINAVWDSRGTLTKNGSYTSDAAFTTGDVIGIAFDADALTCAFYKNGVLTTSATGLSSGKTWFPTFYDHSYVASMRYTCNFGQGGQSGLTYNSAAGGSFKYSPPAGFKALSTANLPAPAILKPSQYFAATAYTGTGGNLRIGDVVSGNAPVTIARSLRFNNASSANLSRTPGSAGNQTKWTYSTWFKRSSRNNYQRIFGTGSDVTASPQTSINFSLDKIDFYNANGGTRTTNKLMMDSEWHHLVVIWDSGNATASDRIQIWIDGIRETSFAAASDPALNATTDVNSAQDHRIGVLPWSSTNFYGGYFADIYFIDGQALTASSFGQTDSTTGEWVPKSYGGTYGTNGFHLTFSDNSGTTAATMGKDSSGNGNNWTPSGFNVLDAVIDTPTSSFATLDPFRKASGETLSSGNLATSGNATHDAVYATCSVPQAGSFYFECTVGSTTTNVSAVGFGLIRSDHSWNSADHYTGVVGNASNYCSSGQSLGFPDGSYLSYGPGLPFAAGDVLQVAVKWPFVWMGRNNVWLDSAGGTTGNPSTGANPTMTVTDNGTYYPFVNTYSNSATMNFGQGGISGTTYDSASGGSFKYTPPTGFKAMTTANAASVSSGSSFAPDLVWIKSRSAATDHAVYDTTRGAGADLATNTNAVQTSQPTGVMGFTSTGFVVGSLAKVNTAGATYAAWSWKKGATPGFDVVSYTGNGGSAHAVNHSLGAVPKFVIVKGIGATGTTDAWPVYHVSAGANNPLYLYATYAAISSSGAWGGIAPTSSQFTVGNWGGANASGISFVAYLWSEIQGYSKFGTYTGNGSTDGSFVWCGFRPAFLMVKRTDTSANWHIIDSTRDSTNPTGMRVLANSAVAEADTRPRVDFLANGFKCRDTDTDWNASGGTYIFVAFAEAPFKNSLAR